MFAKQSYTLRQLLHRISIRERILILITIFIAVLALSQGVMWLMDLTKHDAVERRISQKQNESNENKRALQSLRAALNNPRIQSLTNSNQDLRQRIEDLEGNIADINDKLMSPDRMLALLEELLENQDDLSLSRFDVKPVVTINSSLDGGTLFFQHGLSIELEGQFESLASYLEKIEALPTQLFWDSLVIETDNFPLLTIKIDVHTLSQDEEWLNV